MSTPQQIVFGAFRVDPTNACLWRDSQPIPVTPKAFGVLSCLVEHAGQLVPKRDLLSTVWKDVVVGEASLTVCVRELRRVLDDNARCPQYVETVHRRGYRFLAPVTAVPGPPQEIHSPVRAGPVPAAGNPAPIEPVRVPEPTSASCRSAGPLAVLPGRSRELQQLHAWLDEARQGRRQVVFVTGELGIGKTALVETFLTQVAAAGDVWIARGQCWEQHGSCEAYQPILVMLGQLARQPGTNGTLATLLARHAPTWLTQLPSLLAAGGQATPQPEALGGTRERMLREMCEALEAVTEQQVLVLSLMQLHWADDATLDLIAALARSPNPARLLLLGTYRPVDAVVGAHPLRGVVQELKAHGRCAELSLSLVDEAAVAQYLASRFPAHDFPPELAALIHHRTDGNPLFMVNVVDHLMALGTLFQQDGTWHWTGAIQEVVRAVPETIRTLIEKHIDQLRPEEQQVLAGASIAGAAFSAADVLHDELVRVEQTCAALAQREQLLEPAGMNQWRDGTAAAFRFRYALYRDVVHQRVTAARGADDQRRLG